jgi:hypothetical protein
MKTETIKMYEHPEIAKAQGQPLSPLQLKIDKGLSLSYAAKLGRQGKDAAEDAKYMEGVRRHGQAIRHAYTDALYSEFLTN